MKSGLIAPAALLTVLSLSPVTSVSSDKGGVKWMSFNSALEEAKRSDKKVLIDVYTDWCGWCRKMDAQTYTDKGVVAYVNRKYVAVKLNAESRAKVVYRGTEYAERELASAFGITGFPSTIFLAANAEPITIYPGFADASRFLDVVSFIAEDHYLSKSFAEYTAGKK